MRVKLRKRLLLLATVAFITMNVVAGFHASKFTHFAEKGRAKTKNPEQLTISDKLVTLLLGINNPRPENKLYPAQQFSTVLLQSNKQIACWHIKCSSPARGTVIFFHGYSGSKSTMLDKSYEFIKMGYNTLLVDFMGSGGSEGSQSTIGYKEAEQVKTAYEYVKAQGDNNIILFGTSMGAAAVLRAVCEYGLAPAQIIAECPFGSMYETTCARFRIMHVPAFPMAGLLVFWGGVLNGFNAFGHNPREYAKQVHCPTLLLYGEQDRNVSRQETNDIYNNLKGRKMLRTYKTAEHENYLIRYHDEWVTDVQTFLAMEN